MASFECHSCVSPLKPVAGGPSLLACRAGTIELGRAERARVSRNQARNTWEMAVKWRLSRVRRMPIRLTWPNGTWLREIGVT
jgi:hypothetical protein